MIVVDASPVIALSKIRRLALLQRVFERALIGPSVRREVLEHVEHVRSFELADVRAATQAGWLKEVRLSPDEDELSDSVRQGSGLHAGETESIALASVRKLMLVVDDKEARALAATRGVRYIGTAAVLLEGYRRSILNLDEFEQAVRDLGRVSWMSPAVATEVLRRARRMRS